MMADIYYSELRAAISGRLSFNEFCEKYFHAKYDPQSFTYINAMGEKLSSAIAGEFYEEFISTGWTLEKYIEKTTCHEVD
jgi:hypothetical protein